MLTVYICELCRREFIDSNHALECEESHKRESKIMTLDRAVKDIELLMMYRRGSLDEGNLRDILIAYKGN